MTNPPFFSAELAGITWCDCRGFIPESEKSDTVCAISNEEPSRDASVLNMDSIRIDALARRLWRLSPRAQRTCC
jgi:hypothetical protein